MDSNYLQKDDEEPGDAAREDEGDGGGELNDVADDLGDAATAEKAEDNSEEAPNKSAGVTESDNVLVSGSSADAKEE